MSFAHINNNPALKAANGERLRRMATAPEFSDWRSARARKVNANPHKKELARKLMAEIAKRPEIIAVRVANMARINSDPEIIERRIKSVKALYSDREWVERRADRHRASIVGCEGVECPRWVPATLRLEYFEFAKEFGEEEAASRVRNLKREMERPFV